VATLLVGATGIFAEIQDSINKIWGIKAKPKKGWLKIIQNRFLSFSVIISLGFLLVVSLAVTTILDGFNNRLQAAFPEVTIVVFYILNQALTFIVISLLFAVIFRVLPDAKNANGRTVWKDSAPLRNLATSFFRWAIDNTSISVVTSLILHHNDLPVSGIHIHFDGAIWISFLPLFSFLML